MSQGHREGGKGPQDDNDLLLICFDSLLRARDRHRHPHRHYKVQQCASYDMTEARCPQIPADYMYQRRS